MVEEVVCNIPEIPCVDCEMEDCKLCPVFRDKRNFYSWQEAHQQDRQLQKDIWED